MESPTLKKNTENGILWLCKVVAGLVIILLLGIHYLVNHLIYPNGLLSYSDIIKYYTNPIIPIMEFVFLVIVLAHAALGVRSIFLDLNPSVKSLRIINRIINFMVTCAGIYGIWLIILIVRRGLPG